MTDTPTQADPAEMDRLQGLMYLDILQNGISVQDGNGKLVREHPGAALMKEIRQWINEHKSKGDASNPFADAIKASVARKKQPMPPLSEDDDAATR